MNEGAQFDSTFLTIDSYTAPEIARAQANHELMLGEASLDIWSLGCIMYVVEYLLYLLSFFVVAQHPVHQSTPFA